MCELISIEDMYTEFSVGHFSSLCGEQHSHLCYSQPAFLCEPDCEISPKFYDGGLGRLPQLR